MSEKINKNFKGLYDTSKTTFITDRTEPTNFYEPEAKTPRIKNVSYSINFDKKELYKAIKDLQQKVEQLEKENIRQKEVIENLTTMTVCGDKKQIKNTAQYKLEQLENIRKEAIKYINNHQLVFRLSSKKQIENWFDEFYKDLLNILNKGDNNE